MYVYVCIHIYIYIYIYTRCCATSVPESFVVGSSACRAGEQPRDSLALKRVYYHDLMMIMIMIIIIISIRINSNR